MVEVHGLCVGTCPCADEYNCLTLCALIPIAFRFLQTMIDQEELQFHEEYMNDQDPSILHFLLASGDDVWTYIFMHYVIIIIFYLLTHYLSLLVSHDSVLTYLYWFFAGF